MGALLRPFRKRLERGDEAADVKADRVARLHQGLDLAERVPKRCREALRRADSLRLADGPTEIRDDDRMEVACETCSLGHRRPASVFTPRRQLIAEHPQPRAGVTGDANGLAPGRARDLEAPRRTVRRGAELAERSDCRERDGGDQE